MNVPQLASAVRGRGPMYSLASQMFPSRSTAAGRIVEVSNARRG